MQPLAHARGVSKIDEVDLQDVIDQFPECLPLSEIDPEFSPVISVCKELSTPAGSLDNLLITPSGLPILVECKLWRNPEARREVVGQILDYARIFARWTVSDLNREVARRRKGRPEADLFSIVRSQFPETDEIAFNDAVSRNLRIGRFMLLVVGDGIREGVEAIADYLQAHSGLHFVFGLVELPVFQTASGDRLFLPRILTRTVLIEREISAQAISSLSPTEAGAPEAEQGVSEISRFDFWKLLLSGLELDDREQPVPRPGHSGSLAFMLPAPGGSSWVNVYRSVKDLQVGLYLSSTRSTPGEFAMQALEESFEDFAGELGPDVRRMNMAGKKTFGATFDVPSFADEQAVLPAIEWLRDRTNRFINILRPRVRALASDHRP